MRGALTTLTLLLALALTACAERPLDDAMFPLAEGRRWTYDVKSVWDLGAGSERTERDTLTLSNRGAQALGGARAWRRRSDSGVEYWLQSDASGIYRVASRSPVQREPLPDEPRRYVLQKPYAVGTQWEASTTAYLLARRNELPHALRHFIKPFPMVYRIEALDEKVQTAAGQFERCLRVAGRAEIRLYVDAMFQWRQIPLTTLEWYCPDVGLVKLERNEPSPTKFMVGGSMTMELASWQ